MQKFKRRQLIVDVVFQSKMMVRFACSVLIVSFAIGIIVFFMTQTSTTVAIEKTRVYAKPTSDFILPVLSLTVLSVAAVGAGVVLYMTLFLSHRIVGPVFRMRKELESLKKGQLKRNFTTRDKDELKDLSKALQEMSDALCGRHEGLKKSYETLAEFMKQEENSFNPSTRERLKKILDELGENVDYFKVSKADV